MRVRVYLTIDRIKNVNLEEGHSLMVEIGWIGRNTKFRFPGKRIKRNCTSVQSVQDGGNFVQWNEEFECCVNLRRIDRGCYKSWFINLEVHELDGDSKNQIVIAPKTRIDISEDLVLGTERTIRISLDCKIRDNLTFTATLEAKIQVTEIQSERRRRSLSLPKSTRFRLFSCIGGEHHGRNSQHHRQNSHNARPIERIDYEFSLSRVRSRSVDGSSSEDEPEPSYKNLQLCNYLIDQFNSKEEYDDSLDGSHEFSPNVDILSSNSFDRRQPQNQSPLQRLLSLKRLISFKKNDQPKGKPLLNKLCCEIGGDDIDIERHEELGVSHSQRSKVHPDLVFDEDERFEVGSWERRSFFSRDSELELVTDSFLATIDQRSERASGGSACTVLAVLIADWLYKNPVHLPLRCEMDQLVLDGSRKWRDLCRDTNHRERFSDQHFDLETVLGEGVGQLREVVELSYLGFFRPEGPQESMAFLEDMPSFDSIWDKMIVNDLVLMKRVYICSWNDHFFVLQIEGDVIHLIDTFGERLFEGCNQAYILKFDKDSVIYSSFEETIIDESNLETNKENKKENNSNKQENGVSKLEMNKETKQENTNKQQNGESKLEMNKETKQENTNKEENSGSKLEMAKETKEEENNNKQENGKIKLEVHKEHKDENNNKKQENGESKLEMHEEHKEEDNNSKQEYSINKLEPKLEESNNKEEDGESKLEMHIKSKHEENNNKQANGFLKEKENNNMEDEHAKIQEENINFTSVDDEIKIEQEKINHSLTNTAIREKIKCPNEEIEEIKCPKEEIVRDQGKEMEPCSSREGNCERVESSKVVICEGLESCREYMKGFLASLPLRQLQEDLKSGFIREETLHRRLQIEFHYVVPRRENEIDELFL